MLFSLDYMCFPEKKESRLKENLWDGYNNRGTTQIAYIKICHLSGSNKPYAFTQQSREEPTDA